MTRTSQNQREEFLICPTPLPGGQDRFKQFPNPEPEGLNLSRGLPGGMVTGQCFALTCRNDSQNFIFLFFFLFQYNFIEHTHVQLLLTVNIHKLITPNIISFIESENFEFT